MTLTLLAVLLALIGPVRLVTIEDHELRAWALHVPLASAEVGVVPGDPIDPDGDGPFHTRLATVPQIAVEHEAVWAVNGDFFAAAPAELFGRPVPFPPNAPARLIGHGLSDGRRFATPFHDRPTLWLGDGQATIGMKQPPWATDAVSGSGVILAPNQPLPEPGGDRHPRTIAGLTADGQTLVLLVADGRRPGWSMGLTLREAALIMKAQACAVALNLDGGGSTTLVFRDQVLNRPSDGIHLGPDLSLPRPVANAVVIEFDTAE
jgi:hypothetical protein